MRSIRNRLISLGDISKSLLILLGASLIFGGFKFSALLANHFFAPGLYILFVVSVVLSILFFSLKYEYGKAFSILARGIGGVLGVYALIAYPSFDSYAYETIRFAAVVCGIASLWRPSFLLPVSVYTIISKYVAGIELGIGSLSYTDYLPVAELGIYLALGVVLHRLMPERPREIGTLLFMTALAIHFGNYFYSAIEKVNIGLIEWIFYNDTQNLVLVTRESGTLPIAHFSELTDWIIDKYPFCVELANLTIFLGQILCIVAINRVRWAIWITAFYDLTHVVIFILTGILFWKWILLNLFLVLALISLKDIKIERWVRLTSMAYLILGGNIFFAAHLGWFDTPSIVHHYFVAETKDGKQYRVPSNYFLTGSVKVAQQRLGTIGTQYPVATWGTTKSISIKHEAESDCQFKSPKNRYVLEENELAAFVRKHHRFVLSRVDENGLINYDLYPHHIFSNPYMYQDFYLLDKRSISHYKYVTESICFNGQDKRVENRQELVIGSL